MCWKATKWVEIRYKTMTLENNSFLTRFYTYFVQRQTDDQTASILQGLMKSSTLKTDFKKLVKKSEGATKKQKVHFKYDTGGNMNKAKKDFTKYLPVIVLWGARLNMFVLAYMYHTEVSFINVMWVIISFILPDELILLVSSVVMVPILSWEFVLIYGSRIPIVSDTYFFKTFGS